MPLNLDLKFFLLLSNAYISVSTFSIGLEPENVLKLFANLSSKQGTVWGYRKDGDHAVIFFNKQQFRIQLIKNYIKVPRIYCFDFLPPVIIKHIISESEKIKIIDRNKIIQVDNISELKDCQLV